MTTQSDAPVSRQRGSIRRRARCWEVRVSAGDDPSTGERIVLVDSVEIDGQGERADRAAFREAEKLRTKLLADPDALKVARTKATVGALLERWMQQHEIDPTTRMTYESQIRMYIVPARSSLRPALVAGARRRVVSAPVNACAPKCSSGEAATHVMATYDMRSRQSVEDNYWELRLMIEEREAIPAVRVASTTTRISQTCQRCPKYVQATI